MSTQRLLHRAAVGLVRAVDAAAAPHGIDRYVEQVIPTWSSTEVRGRIVAVDRSAPDSVVLTIRPNGNWTAFRPGQYTQLSVDIDGVRHTRCYSMASAPSAVRASAGTHEHTPARPFQPRTFQLGVKAHPHGLVSRHLVANAAVGQVVGLTPPAGDFVLGGTPGDRPDRILLISGGSGITPVLSMLRTLAAEGHSGPVTFLHYARSRDAVVLRSAVDAIAATHPNVTVVHGFDDQPEPGPGRVTGFLTADHLDAVDPQWRDAETYVCGPAPMMDAAREAFAAAGALDRFHTEAFTLANIVGEAGDVGGTLTLSDSGRTLTSDGATILAQAENAGLTPESGCRMGICHTCTRSLTCGTVRDVTNGELTTTDPTTGAVDVRICVSAPIGDVAIDL